MLVDKDEEFQQGLLKHGVQSRAIISAFLLILLSACATRPPESADLRAVDPVGSISLFDAEQNTKKLKTNFVHNPHLQILALSGGGADGAFGAGVLCGWSETGNRPEFDIVTGVSTGALMATMAFVGPEYDSELERIFTTTTSKDIFVSKPLNGLFSDSLLDYTPLKMQVERVINEQLLDKVAQEYHKGRRLYVATTNLDAGKLVVWDMGMIAASSHPQRVRIFQKRIRASAAIPTFFKPVYIQPRATRKERQMHVDGGVKAPILIRSFMFDTLANEQSLYVIMNGQIKLTEAAEAVSPDVASIARKAIQELLRGLTYKTLYQGYVTTRNAGANFYMIAIPDNISATRDALNFDPQEMQKLFEEGKKLGHSSKSWMKEPPRLEDLERVAAGKKKPSK
jgi:predicted acylesterase/phospholipase RssA